MTHKKFFLSRI